MITQKSLVFAAIFGALFAGHIASGATLFSDDYSNPATAANYTTTDAPGSNGAFAIAGGLLNYTRTDTSGYNSDTFLTVAPVTTGSLNFTTSGDLIAPGGGGRQPGLILTGSTALGGFVVQEYDAGAQAGHFVLLRETGGQLGGDEGGNGNPPLLADFGVINAGAFSNADTFRVIGNVNFAGVNPVITVTIDDLTNSQTFASNVASTDTTDTGVYGGGSVGFRARANSTGSVTETFDNLTVTTPVPEPETIAALIGGAAILLGLRRRSVG